MAYSVHNCLPNLLPPFPEFKESVLTPEQIANNLRDEMKRLKKRREFRGQVGSSFVCLGGTFNFQFNNILV